MEQSFSDRVAAAMQVVTALSPHEAAALQEAEEVIFVDPRPAKAIAASTGIIRDSLNIELHSIGGRELPPELDNQSVHIVTACQGGPMGAVAAHEFKKVGFPRVNYVEGGTQAWLDAGYPTVK